MPAIPIVDSHVHLWDPGRLRIPWLDGHSLLDKPYLLADYRQHTAGLDVEGIVYLEVDLAPSYTLIEPRWVADLSNAAPNDGPPILGIVNDSAPILGIANDSVPILGIANDSAPILGIVPFAPVEYGDRLRAYLDALVAVDPRVKGVRRLYQSEPDLDFCIRPDFIRGVQILAEYGLSFDLGVRHIQLENTIALVRACPDTSFVLDHIGKPAIKAGLLDPWRDQIRELAALPNVACKLSGMTTEADWQHWTVDDLRPYAEHVLTQFGEDRVMYGGDWPVSYQATPYRRWAETVDALTDGLPPEAQRKLWNTNARRFYRLDRAGR